ncbi:MAG TPA: hypothetical protein VMA34_04425 [Terracidiphilus sp.]|nr:hypothetical protein [Terracidiphilus sp.]
MLPDSAHPVWIQIATGKKAVSSGKLAINLLIQNNRIEMEKDASPAHVKEIAGRTYQFFKQYETIFASEFQKILG